MKSLKFCVSKLQVQTIFVKPTCGERDIVVTTTFRVYASVVVCGCCSEFVWTKTSTSVYGFQNNLTQLFSIMYRCAM